MLILTKDCYFMIFPFLKLVQWSKTGSYAFKVKFLNIYSSFAYGISKNPKEKFVRSLDKDYYLFIIIIS